MRAARYVFEAELRRGGWRFVLGMALLLGLVGGGALLAASGARRTASAFERLEEQTLAASVLVNPNSEEAVAAVTTDGLRSIHGVAAVAHAGGLLAFVNGNYEYHGAVFQGMTPDWFTKIDRPLVREGRLPDQSRAEEFFASPAAAIELGLHVGDGVDLLYISADELPDRQGGTFEDLRKLLNSGAIGHHVRGRLVGIGFTTGDAVPGASLASVSLTQAFARETKAVEMFGGDSVRLRAGASVDRFIQDVRALAPNDASIDFQTLSSDRDTVHRAVTPHVFALLALAVALLIGAVLASAQAIGRRAAFGTDDDLALSAAGMTAGERRSVDWMRLVAATGLGTVLAVFGAGLASSMTPIGVARDAEPTPGVVFDWVALGLGGLILGGLAAALGVLATLRAKRATAQVARPSQLATLLRGLTANAPLAVGVGLALEPGRGRTSVPTRSTLVAACTGLVAIVASLTFGASLRQLITSPQAYGVTFDAMVGIVDEPTADKLTTLAAALERDPKVIGAADLYLEQVRAPKGLVSAYGLEVTKGEGPLPTLVSGRVPTRRDEVALGATTMRRESLELGDDVTFSHGSDQTAQRFTVVGQVVLPGITQYGASDQPSLGEGALFELDGFSALTGFTPFSPGSGREATLPITALIDLQSGASPTELARNIDRTFGNGIVSVAGPSKSADIESLARVRSSPLILAGLLGTVAAFAVGHALVVSVTRRRRDLAVLRTIGFTPGQVSLAVGWQATTVAAIACGVGIPAGLLAGRIAWSSVAHQLGVVDRVAVHVAVVLVVPAAILFANIVALAPGWRAARLRPAEILRSE